MSFRALLLSGCVVLTGCQITSEAIQPTSADIVAPATSIASLKTIDLDLPSTKKIAINQYSQYLDFDGIDSPVAAFKVPANEGTLDFSFVSEINDSVFVPYVKIFDENGNELAVLNSDRFEYSKPKLHWGNTLEAEFTITPMLGSKHLVVVIYTEKSQLGKFTNVIHPARLDAEARGNYLPEVKDIPVPHAMNGTVEITVSSEGLVMYQQQAHAQMQAQAKPVVKVNAIPETQAYYHNAIRTAVESNNLDKALSLLEEAKALNVEGAQQVFIKAVNAK